MSYKTKIYFAYGMNTNIGEMAFRCPQARRIGTAVLKDYVLAFKTHADVEFCPGREVHGVLWEITSKCEDSLDILEGYPVYYDKSSYVVTDSQGQRVEAMLYQMTSTYGDNRWRMPSTHYVDCLLEGYEDNGLDTGQIYAALEEFSDYVYAK